MIKTKRTVTKDLGNGIQVNLHRSISKHGNCYKYIVEAIRQDGSLIMLCSAANRYKAFKIYRGLKLVA